MNIIWSNRSLRFPRYSALARYTGFGRYLDDDGQWIQVYGPANNPNYDLHWENKFLGILESIILFWSIV